MKTRCDMLAAKLVKERDGKCRRCGVGGSLDWAHILSRRYHAVRWNLDNAVALCRKDHRYFTDHPFAFAEWLREQGIDILALERLGNQLWDRDYARVLRELGA